jgi:NADH dehydrogenase
MKDKQGTLVTVTGAAGFTGRFITEALLDNGFQVRSLVNRLDRPDPFGGKVEYQAYQFQDFEGLVKKLKGSRVLVNTYWVRFNRGEITFDNAVRNSRTLFSAAREARVERIVHISVTKPSPGPELPYFRGKWQVEQELEAQMVPYTILRPTLIFGPGDILINNIAYLLRRLPVFAIPGDGKYRIQPVYARDLADLVRQSINMVGNQVFDAAGPEIYEYRELVQMVASAVGSSARLFHIPPGTASFLGKIIGWFLGDVLITRDEIRGLMADKLVSNQPPRGSSSFREWLFASSRQLGIRYASELARNFNLQSISRNIAQR